MNRAQNILEGALELIQTEGWAQHSFSSLEGKGPYCVLGAINRSPYRICNANNIPILHEAKQAVADVVGLADYTSLMIWNDVPERTYEDVMLAIKQAIHNLED